MLRSEHVDLKQLFPETVTGTRYLTHGFDSYPAKMIPHMARFLIEKVSKKGATILDPFCGSGAVLVESILNDRNAIGIDFNSLAIALSTAKTTAYDVSNLKLQLREILNRVNRCAQSFVFDFPNSDYWFTPATILKLGRLRTVLDGYLPTIDDRYARFWLAIAFTIVRKCSRADMRGPKPFISKKARATRVGRHFDPIKLFEHEANTWFGIEAEYGKRIKDNNSSASVELILGDSRKLSAVIKDRVVDAVVTSPPYLSAQDYYRSSKLQRFIFEKSTQDEMIAWSRDVIGTDRLLNVDEYLEKPLSSPLALTIRKRLLTASGQNGRKSAAVFAKYVLDMSMVLQQLKTILKDGAPCAIVLGYNLISHTIVPTPEVIVEIAGDEGMQLEARFSDKIRDRWVPTIRNGHKGVIDEEHLLLFKRVPSKQQPPRQS